MARPKIDLPTPAELRALVFMHEHGPCTVKEYLEEGGLKKEGRAYTSVMSLLSVMFDKGLATRTEVGRAFRYAPAVPLPEVRTKLLHYVLANAFGGSLDEMKAAVAKLEKRKK
jgi:BlaI family penicillinase repressor